MVLGGGSSGSGGGDGSGDGSVGNLNTHLGNTELGTMVWRKGRTGRRNFIANAFLTTHWAHRAIKVHRHTHTAGGWRGGLVVRSEVVGSCSVVC